MHVIPPGLSQVSAKFARVPRGQGSPGAPRPSLNAATCSPGPKYALDGYSQQGAMDEAWKRAVRTAKAQNRGNFDEHNGPITATFARASRFPPGKVEGGLGDKSSLIKSEQKSTMSGAGKSIGNGRASWEKVLTPGYEASMYGYTSPGPGPPINLPISSVGTKIGTAVRFPRATYERPGPGPAGYDQTHKTVSAASQPLSDTRSAPAIGFGKASKKPRFRMQQAIHGSPHGCWGYF